MLGSFLRFGQPPKASGLHYAEGMPLSTILIIVLVVLLLGGGGYFYRR